MKKLTDNTNSEYHIIHAPSTSLFDEGYTISSFNDLVYVKLNTGLFSLDPSNYFKKIDLPPNYSISNNGVMCNYKSGMAVILFDNSKKPILAFFKQNKWNFPVFPEKCSIMVNSYILEREGSIFMSGVNTDGATFLLAFNGSSFRKIELPVGYQMGLAINLPSWYPPFNMVNFHVGLHMVLINADREGIPFSFQGWNGERYVFERWVGTEGMSIVEGTEIINYSLKKTLVAFMNSNGTCKMYHHVSPSLGSWEEITLPDGFFIAEGYQSLEFKDAIFLFLADANKEIHLFTYQHDFEKVVLENLTPLNFGCLYVYGDTLYIMMKNEKKVPVLIKYIN